MVVSSLPIPRSALFAQARPEWLALRSEEVIDRDRPIVDSHLHLWDRDGQPYLLEQALADLASGHNIVATVFVECHAMYRASGPECLRPVGEIEFATGLAAMSASGNYGPTALCAAIVGNADLTLGECVRSVLEAEIDAAGGRFRGIRHATAHETDPAVLDLYASRPKGLLADTTFRCGFACLEPLGLTFDAWLFHPQIAELGDLARAFPNTMIVLDHCGGPIGIGAYAGHRQEVFESWRTAIRLLAKEPNVHVKLGGLGLRLLGYDLHERPAPPSSEDLAAAWGPYIETCIDAFGPDRCMFESDFPPDKGQCSYQVLFNAFKRIASQYSEAEKTALFSATAGRFYKLDLGAA